jgi:hypothetical protein
MIVLLATLALAAGDGVHCVAVWRAPVPGCPLDGAIEASATRGTVDAAARAARRSLARALEFAGDQIVERVQNRYSAEFALCEDLVEEGSDLICTEAQSAVDGDLCFITFDDAECWDGTVATFDRSGWRSALAERAEFCDAVDDRIVAQNYRGLEERRQSCQERCAVGATVSCPPGR